MKVHSILDCLPESLAQQLSAARAALAAESKLDERGLMPAWHRYTGELYKAAGASIGNLIGEGAHVAIVSGGYGLLMADEAIGWYDMRFRLARWPHGLLESVLETLVRNLRLTAVRAFASASTDYGRLLRRVHWKVAGISDGLLFVPGSSAGAYRKSPRAQGEAMSSLIEGNLTRNWKSSDGLPIEAIPLT